ncbi:hypothetical protein SLNSH_22345 [Alsobacter soli]|uniref:Peptidase S14 n=1 Tax=Alsobacter soli TaxID=2109933 RepID=A0A2T1HMA0_9HYPH|nr:ATP-dependent Clp protease proteolytic subunit [Alsobacter soli]PSC02785.1 hypothetical protein SLNSH_22345 [Alsobacter soli]
MRARAAVAVALAGAVLAASSPSQAATLAVLKPKRGPVALVIQGKIDTGDSIRFAQLLLALDEAKLRPAMVALDSPGGYLGESLAIAETVRRRGIATYASGTCASGCFMIFAAGTKRLAAKSARIGVHTAYTGAGSSDRGTSVMASYALRYGVPPLVVAKMIATTAPNIAWLDRQDIKAMHVQAMR